MTLTILMPDEIDQSFLAVMLHELESHEGDEPIRLMCSSNGGYSRPTIAVVQLLRHYPFVHGYLVGAAVSSAGFIWAACAKRYVYPDAYLGIHGVCWSSGAAGMNAREMRAKADEFEAIDQMQCRTFAAASNKDYHWWYEKLTQSTGLQIFQSGELVALGMAELVSEGKE